MESGRVRLESGAGEVVEVKEEPARSPVQFVSLLCPLFPPFSPTSLSTCHSSLLSS